VLYVFAFLDPSPEGFFELPRPDPDRSRGFWAYTFWLEL